DRVAATRQIGAGFGDGGAAIVDQGRREYAVCASVERRGEMLELPRPAGGDHGNPHRLRDGPGEGKVVAVLGAVGIHRGQQDLPRSEVLQSHHPLHGFESGGLASPPNRAFPPPPPPPLPPPGDGQPGAQPPRTRTRSTSSTKPPSPPPRSDKMSSSALRARGQASRAAAADGASHSARSCSADTRGPAPGSTNAAKTGPSATWSTR